MLDAYRFSHSGVLGVISIVFCFFFYTLLNELAEIPILCPFLVVPGLISAQRGENLFLVPVIFTASSFFVSNTINCCRLFRETAERM